MHSWPNCVARLTCLVALSLSTAAASAQQPNQNRLRLLVDRQLEEQLNRPLNTISVDRGSPEARLPQDRSAAAFRTDEQRQPAAGEMTRGWARTTYHWQPADLAHQPLYFDQQPLERYGQTPLPRLQPILSGAHFFASIAALPYKVGVDRVYAPVYTLGYYRPGSPAPCLRQRLPWELDAAALESGAWLGLIFLLP